MNITFRKRTALLNRGLLLFMVFVTSLVSVCSATAAEYRSTVKVGFFPLNYFYEHDEDGHLIGYGVEYLNQIAQQAGWNLEYVEADSWVSALKDFENGKTDLLAPSQMTAERMEKYSFCAFPMGTEYGSILTLKTNESLIFEDFSEFSNLKMGCVPSLVFYDSFQKYADEHGFDSQIIYYKNTPALVSALYAGEVNAIIANLMVKTDTMKPLGKFGAAPYYCMVRKDDSALLSQFNNAVQEVENTQSGFQSELEKVHFSDLLATPLTKGELDYVASLGEVTVGYVQENAPISYTDEKTGKAAGVTIDVIDRVAEYSGLKIKYVPLPIGDVTYEYLRDNDIELVSNVEYNRINASDGMHLTNPYLSARKVFVEHGGKTFEKDSYMTLAIVRGSQTLSEAILSEYPNFVIKRYNSVEDCFESVRRGDADLLLHNQYVVEPFLAKPQYQALSVVPVEGLADKLCLSLISYQSGAGVADDTLTDSRLVSILNKGIALINSNELSKMIIHETRQARYRYTFADLAYEHRELIAVLMVAAVLTCFVGAYILKLKRRSTRILKQSEWKLRNITNNINGGVVVLHLSVGLKINFANEGFLALIGLTREEFESRSQDGYVTFVHPDDIPMLNNLIAENVENDINEKVSIELRLQRRDGSYLPTLFNGTLATESSGEKMLYCVIMDNSLQTKMNAALKRSQQRYELLMETSGDLLYEVDLLNREVSVTGEFLKKLGWTFPKNIQGNGMSGLAEMWHVRDEDKIVFIHSVEKILRDRISDRCELRILKNDNKEIWCELLQFPMISDDGTVASIVGRISDIDAEKTEKKQLAEKSMRDAMTGLYNKKAFCKLAGSYLNDNLGTASALVFIDLDNFKLVNDTLGHIMGDHVILEAAEKLRVIFSNFDIISRFGGDEYCVLVKDIPYRTLQDKLDWLIHKMRKHYKDNEKSVEVSASVGVVYTNGYESDIDYLISEADKELYRAKEKGKCQYSVKKL